MKFKIRIWVWVILGNINEEVWKVGGGKEINLYGINEREDFCRE